MHTGALSDPLNENSSGIVSLLTLFVFGNKTLFYASDFH